MTYSALQEHLLLQKFTSKQAILSALRRCQLAPEIVPYHRFILSSSAGGIHGSTDYGKHLPAPAAEEREELPVSEGARGNNNRTLLGGAFVDFVGGSAWYWAQGTRVAG